MFVRNLFNKEEALSMPTCGVRGVWKEAGEAFFFRAGVVSKLTRVSALTLYFFWEPAADRWMSQQELEAGGMEEETAREVAAHLQESLLESVQAAV